MLKTFRCFFGLVFLIVFVGCDMEKLTSYRYEDASGNDSTSFSGRIQRKDTGKPVSGAVILVHLRKAISDLDGRYLLSIQYNEDINRNLPVPFIVSAKNFAVYDEDVQILPEPMLKSIDLVWAVPIISNPMVDSLDGEGEYWTSATVTDYQGIETIEEVIAHFSTGSVDFDAILLLDHKQNENTALFKSDAMPIEPDLDLGWQIEATDVDGHTDFLYITRNGTIIRRDPE